MFRPDGTISLFVGTSRSAKSVPLKVAVQTSRRAVAFDPKGEYAMQLGFTPYYDFKSFYAAVWKHRFNDVRLAFVASDKESFNLFCGAAFIFNKCRMADIICEELGAVTNMGKAEGHWGKLVNQGLAFGPSIYATVQRGQEVDKTIMNNATFLHIVRHRTENDAKYIAGQLGLDQSEIPREKFKFIQWTSDKGLVVNGQIDRKKVGEKEIFTGRANKYWKTGSPVFREMPSRKILKIQKSGKFEGLRYD